MQHGAQSIWRPRPHFTTHGCGNNGKLIYLFTTNGLSFVADHAFF
jgi:hypothetical protein